MKDMRDNLQAQLSGFYNTLHLLEQAIYLEIQFKFYLHDETLGEN